MRKYWLYKSGTVCPICQTCAAPDIRIPNELACIINDRLSIWRRLCGNFGSLRLLYIFLDFLRHLRFFGFPGHCIVKCFCFFFSFLLRFRYQILRIRLRLCSCQYIFCFYISGDISRFNCRPFSHRTCDLRRVSRIQLSDIFTFLRRFASDIQKTCYIGKCHI